VSLLQDEIDRDMALLGIKALAEMRRELLTIARGPEFLEKRGKTEGSGGGTL
jgi:isopentenyl diphosphate isomerase/L-lactate dehydrogenase-like FMN-dependent dehydrogenase